MTERPGYRAGWAQAEITPPLGLPMGGRGPRFAAGARVLDPLEAQALILEDTRGGQLLWISLDLIGMTYGPSAALRHDLSALTGIPYEAILLNFAHVHSGPMTNMAKYPAPIPEPPDLRRYREGLHRTIVALADAAMAARQRATATLHWGRSDVGINRRLRAADGLMTMGPNPDGPYNAEVWVLDVQGTETEDRCVVFSYGCHPVIVYGYDWEGLSAEYPGVCRRTLRDQLGADVHCQFVQALAGNVRPRVLADLETETFRTSTPEDLQRAGTTLAADVLDALHSSGEALDLEPSAAAGWVYARRDPDRVPDLDHWEALAAQEDELSRNVGRYWAKRLTEGPSHARVVPLEVGLVQLAADHRVAWISAEAVAEWLPRLRRWLDNSALWVCGYTQTVSTYLPVDALLAEGGYEVVASNRYDVHGPGPFAPGLDAGVARVFAELGRD